MVQRVFIDVREPQEYAEGHVKDALNLTAADLSKGSSQLNTLPKDSEIIVYCRSGMRSKVALKILKDKGFTNLTNGVNQAQIEATYPA